MTSLRAIARMHDASATSAEARAILCVPPADAAFEHVRDRAQATRGTDFTMNRVIEIKPAGTFGPGRRPRRARCGRPAAAAHRADRENGDARC